MSAPFTRCSSRLGLVAVAAAAVSSLIACGGVDERVGPWEDVTEPSSDNGSTQQARDVDPEVVQALERAKNQWAAAGTTDYTLKVKLSCFCALQPEDDVEVTVRDGEVIRALGNDGDGAYGVQIDESKFRDWYTVDGMFDRIERSLPRADHLEVVYDSDRGFPSLSAFDYTLASADEGEFFKMWDFIPAEEY